MFLDAAASSASRRGFPRVSGDVPDSKNLSASQQVFSPRERGCSRLEEFVHLIGLVFPA